MSEKKPMTLDLQALQQREAVRTARSELKAQRTIEKLARGPADPSNPAADMRKPNFGVQLNIASPDQQVQSLSEKVRRLELDLHTARMAADTALQDQAAEQERGTRLREQAAQLRRDRNRAWGWTLAAWAVGSAMVYGVSSEVGQAIGAGMVLASTPVMAVALLPRKWLAWLPLLCLLAVGCDKPCYEEVLVGPGKWCASASRISWERPDPDRPAVAVCRCPAKKEGEP